MTEENRIAAFRAFRLAVERAGSQSAFGRRTGAKQQNVSNWLKKHELLPAEYVLAAERETGVSRHDLRPDLYPREDVSHVPVVGRVGDEDSCDRRSVLQLGEPAR